MAVVLIPSWLSRIRVPAPFTSMIGFSSSSRFSVNVPGASIRKLAMPCMTTASSTREVPALAICSTSAPLCCSVTEVSPLITTVCVALIAMVGLAATATRPPVSTSPSSNVVSLFEITPLVASNTTLFVPESFTMSSETSVPDESTCITTLSLSAPCLSEKVVPATRLTVLEPIAVTTSSLKRVPVELIFNTSLPECFRITEVWPFSTDVALSTSKVPEQAVVSPQVAVLTYTFLFMFTSSWNVVPVPPPVISMPFPPIIVIVESARVVPPAFTDITAVAGSDS